MNSKPIRSYKELMEEKERLRSLLKEQKLVLRNDVDAIKAEFEPVKVAATAIAKMFSKEKGNFLLNAGANKVIDLVVKNFILSKAGWFAKVAVPFLLKNYSSHFIAENKDSIMRKIFTFLRRRHHSNGTMHPEGHN